MFDLENGRRILERAIRDADDRIARADMMIVRQRQIIAALAQSGRDPSDAERVLQMIIDGREWLVGLTRQFQGDLDRFRRSEPDG